eukprot:CAMPEP_0118674260 /NCGR_PEP_ID=MMETSP0800-20121206/789_1 /TAXON_ID=210618 ORGANISM="Striatella unipunctata, Strain CCMP2910" /NCGR_SAMPLE_ID=MMETSP0800 /ASSEMBLY_ACC=CAM_ASM_000638 /LENGTH=305 /DNA_ID=CAMNT_0006569435 /DNA_START=372 /DNA_END=1289 /DNA_ORIENTATION=-
MPVRSDVLIGTRFDDKERLTHHNDWLEYHPGNHVFNKAVSGLRDLYRGATAEERAWMIEEVQHKVNATHGRYLHQGRWGDWMVMPPEFGWESTRRALYLQGTAEVAAVHLKESIASHTYGMSLEWNTVMKQVFGVLHMHDLLGKIAAEPDIKNPRAVKRLAPFSNIKGSKRSGWFEIERDVPDVEKLKERKYKTQYKLGDSVYGNFNDEGLYYPGVIVDLDPEYELYDVRYSDGSQEFDVEPEFIRPYYTTFTTGDVVALDLPGNRGMIRGQVMRVTARGKLYVKWSTGAKFVKSYTQVHKLPSV